MRLAIFSRPFYPAIGGLERMALMLATESVRAGHSVEVVTDTPGVSVVDDRSLPFKIARTSRQAERVAAFRRADVVLFMNVSLWGLWAALIAGIPIIFSHHGVYRGANPLQWLLALVKRQLTRFYPNISVSTFVANHIPGKSTTIHNAYESALFVMSAHARRDYDFVLGGRLVSDKGVDLCVRAFARVVAVIPDASLSLIGEGPEKQSLTELVASLGLSKRVTFFGVLNGEELVACLRRHACLLIPSVVEEGFGIVALEGIACCDTVIASARGGLPEAVGSCGTVVVPTVEKLADAMIGVAKARRAGSRLPGQPDEATRMAHLARHVPDVIARQYLEVIERAFFDNARPRR